MALTYNQSSRTSSSTHRDSMVRDFAKRPARGFGNGSTTGTRNEMHQRGKRSNENIDFAEYVSASGSTIRRRTARSPTSPSSCSLISLPTRISESPQRVSGWQFAKREYWYHIELPNAMLIAKNWKLIISLWAQTTHVYQDHARV